MVELSRKEITYYQLKKAGFAVFVWRDQYGYDRYEVHKIGRPPNMYARQLISLPPEMVIFECGHFTEKTYILC